MQSLEFTSYKADLDVWIHKAVREDGTPYWEYILLYTEDILVICDKPIDVLEEIGRHFKLKNKSIGPPKIYLEGNLTKRELEGNNGGQIKAWGFSSSQYVQSVVNNVVKCLKEVKEMSLPNSMDQPIKREYMPKDDSTIKLEPTDVAY